MCAPKRCTWSYWQDSKAWWWAWEPLHLSCSVHRVGPTPYGLSRHHPPSLSLTAWSEPAASFSLLKVRSNIFGMLRSYEHIDYIVNINNLGVTWPMHLLKHKQGTPALPTHQFADSTNALICDGKFNPLWIPRRLDLSYWRMIFLRSSCWAHVRLQSRGHL